MSTIESKTEPLISKDSAFSVGGQPASNEFEYQSISKAALACCVFAILGLSAYLAQVFVVLPILGIGFGIVALSSIRKYPEELVGSLPAKVGLVASVIIFVTAVGMHSYIYATEVPDGYRRITFWDLRDDPRDTQHSFNQKAYEFDGKKVFLKGYVRPGDKKRDLKDFIMVGDFGDCCFGGNPDITEIVEINIKIDDTVDHSYSLRKIGGTFRLNPASRALNKDGIPNVFYTIEADYIR